MKTTTSLIRFVALGIAVIVLGALAGWYYVLHRGQGQLQQESAAQGYGAPVPSFEGSTGSTYANVVSTLGSEGVGAGAASSTSRLWEVSQVPVAGFGWLATTTSELSFVERSSGNVLEADVADRQVRRLSDTLRPKIYEALVAPDGSVVEQGLDTNGTIITFAGDIGTSSPAAGEGASASSSLDLTGVELPEGITAIAEGGPNTLYFLLKSDSGVSLISSNWSDTKETHLLTSPLLGWRLIAPGDGSVFLAQKPLDGQVGYAYKVQKGGSLALVAQAPGLTIAPRASSGALLVGSSAQGSLLLYAKSSANAAPALLSIKTIADKCAWAPPSASSTLIAYCGVPSTIPSQQFLDDWYKGLVHTSDAFYAVNASDASTTLLFDPSAGAGLQLDVENPSVDPSGRYIAFQNAADQSLWILRIAQ